MLPLVSLITCTIGRPEPLSRLLSSLVMQTDRAFELIVVDQSSDAVLIVRNEKLTIIVSER